MHRSQQEAYIIRCFSLLANHIAAQGDAVLSGITYQQWFLLMIIAKMPSREKHVQEIADSVGTSRQNVKKMLETLAGNGYVKIEPSQKDKRALSVKLTAKARRLLKEETGLIGDWTHSLFEIYDDQEVRQLLFLLVKLIESLD